MLSYFVAEPVADDVVRWVPRAVRPRRRCASSLISVAMTARIRATPGSSIARVWFAAAWLAAWPGLPWYDALAWALLALPPASWFHWLLLARTTVLAFGYLPARATGVTIPVGLRRT